MVCRKRHLGRSPAGSTVLAVTDRLGFATCTNGTSAGIKPVRAEGYAVACQGDATYLPSTDDAPHVG